MKTKDIAEKFFTSKGTVMKTIQELLKVPDGLSEQETEEREKIAQQKLDEVNKELDTLKECFRNIFIGYINKSNALNAQEKKEASEIDRIEQQLEANRKLLANITKT